MASDYTLSAKFTVNADGFIDGVNKAQSSLSQIQNKAQNVSKSIGSDMDGASNNVQSSFAAIRSKAQSVFSNIANTAKNGLSGAWNAVRTNTQQIASSLLGVGQAGIAAVAGMAIQGGIDRALNIDNARKKLAGFGHDAQDIESIMDSATQSVRGTAFGLGDAATAAATLSAAGIKSGEDMTNTLKSVANVVAASGRAFNDVGVIFSSVASRGKLMGDDMMQLSSSGVPVLQLLGTYLGKTSKEVSEMVSKGQIDFHTFSEAMRVGLGEAALSSGDTLAGSFANVRAALSRLTAPIFTQAIQVLVEAFKNIAPAIDGFSKSIGGVLPTITPLLAVFAALKGPAAIAGIIGQIPILSGLLGPLSSGLMALSGPVGIALVAFGALVATNKDVQAAIGPLMETLGAIGQDIMSSCAPALESLWSSFQRIGDVIVNIVIGAIESLDSVFGRLYDMETISSIIGGIANAIAFIGDVIASFAEAAAPLITGAIDEIGQAFVSVVEYFTPLGDAFQDTAQAGENFGTDIGLVIEQLTPIFQPAIDGITSGIGMIVEAFSGFGEAVGGMIATQMQMAEQLQEIFAPFIATIQPLIDVYLQNLGVALTTIATIVSTIFGAAFEVAAAIVSAAMNVIAGVITTVTGIIQTVVGVFVGIFTGNWQMAANGAQTVFQGMSNIISGIMGGLQGVLSGIVNGIANIFSSVFNGISTMVGNIFHGIASTIGNVMGDSKNIVSGALDAISGFFRGLHLEFPKIKLPHFSISGTFSLAPPSVPSLGIEWYADGGVLMNPTMFGMNGNKAMIGGEAGPEAVAPISTLTGYISDAVNNSKGDDELISEIAGLREDVRNMRVVMDGQTVGSIVSPYVDSNLGEYKVVANR
nr:MAG TPA: minor tail protein [Caudoviricetes sp.]